MTRYYIGNEDQVSMANSQSFLAFQPSSENCTSYTGRLEQHFIAHGFTNADKQKAVLLSSCGFKTYQLMKNLPKNPPPNPLSDLVKLVKNYHQPAPSAIVQYCAFHSARTNWTRKSPSLWPILLARQMFCLSITTIYTPSSSKPKFDSV